MADINFTPAKKGTWEYGNGWMDENEHLNLSVKLNNHEVSMDVLDVMHETSTAQFNKTFTSRMQNPNNNVVQLTGLSNSSLKHAKTKSALEINGAQYSIFLIQKVSLQGQQLTSIYAERI